MKDEKKNVKIIIIEIKNMYIYSILFKLKLKKNLKRVRKLNDDNKEEKWKWIDDVEILIMARASHDTCTHTCTRKTHFDTSDSRTVIGT